MDALGRQGKTALMIAASLGHAEAVQALLAAGASTTAIDTHGYTALHYLALCWPGGEERTAARAPYLAVAATLLGAGADPAAPDSAGATPAALASAAGAQELLAAFALRTLRTAAEAGDAEAIQGLAAVGVSLDEPLLEGQTALHLAAARGQVQSIQALLAAGASSNVHGARGDTPLHTAAARGQVGAAALSRAKACALPVPRPPLAAYLPACRHSSQAPNYYKLCMQVAALMVLLTGSTDVDAKNATGKTALHLAAACGKVG